MTMRAFTFKIAILACASCFWASNAAAQGPLDTWFDYSFPTSHGAALKIDRNAAAPSLNWANGFSFDWSQSFGLKRRAISARIEPLHNMGSAFIEDFWDFAKGVGASTSGAADTYNAQHSDGLGFGIRFIGMNF